MSLNPQMSSSPSTSPVSSSPSTSTLPSSYTIILLIVVALLALLVFYYVYKSNSQEQAIERLTNEVQSRYTNEEILDVLRQHYNNPEFQVPLLKKVNGIVETRLKDYDQYVTENLKCQHKIQTQTSPSSISESLKPTQDMQQKDVTTPSNENMTNDSSQTILPVNHDHPPPLIDTEGSNEVPTVQTTTASNSPNLTLTQSNSSNSSNSSSSSISSISPNLLNSSGYLHSPPTSQSLRSLPIPMTDMISFFTTQIEGPLDEQQLIPSSIAPSLLQNIFSSVIQGSGNFT